MTKIKAVYLSAEMNPYAKTGGLADVAGALPKALMKKGVDIISVMPKYGITDFKLDYVCDFAVKIGTMTKTCIVRKDVASSSPVYFIDSYDYFDRKGIYGFYDDGMRFAFFCLATLAFLKKIEFIPDIIHLNDWHTGPVAMMLKKILSTDVVFSKTRSLFSIHNLRYQGLFGKDMLDVFGVGEDVFTPEGVEYYGSFNFIKAGIAYSDHISTVSRTYAKEILTEQYGEGLDGLLKARRRVLTGIVNGIDTEDFDPMSKKDMFHPYSNLTVAEKRKNKKALLQKLGLKDTNRPVFSIVSRLGDQKGLTLVLDGFTRLLSGNVDASLVVLGTGDKYYENGFLKLKESFPRNVSMNAAFDLSLAKHIYSGSDIFLMPSNFEPCGLGQLIAMRYGTIPLVRKTGGLADTVFDADEDKLKGNGFCFEESLAKVFVDTAMRAVRAYDDKERWDALVQKAMLTDNSWDHAAVDYIKLYERIMKI